MHNCINHYCGCRSPIKVIRGDVIGIVNDGAIRGLDIDYQSDTEIVSFTFADFHSSQSDIVRYEWEVKTGGDVVLPYSSVGLIVHDGDTNETTGEMLPVFALFNCIRLSKCPL